MNHLAPGALPTDEGNFNSHAKGTLHMAICTCLPEVASDLKKKKKKYRLYGQCKQRGSVMADN